MVNFSSFKQPKEAAILWKFCYQQREEGGRRHAGSRQYVAQLRVEPYTSFRSMRFFFCILREMKKRLRRDECITTILLGKRNIGIRERAQKYRYGIESYVLWRNIWRQRQKKNVVYIRCCTVLLLLPAVTDKAAGRQASKHKFRLILAFTLYINFHTDMASL